MSASKQAKSFCTCTTITATVQLLFSQRDPEFKHLMGLMEAHSANLQNLTLTGIADNNPFLPSSNQAQCAKTSFIKKEHAQQHDHVEGICKCKQTTTFYLTLL
jgi:hypothetical protein